MRKPTTSAFLWLLRFALLVSATMLCLCLSVQAQRTLRIPADSPSIQAAIDTASDGDTLLVAPGTYFENLNLHGKAITLLSAEGPSVTILDGRLLAPVVTLATHETRATTLSGFTLRNGAPGGVLLAASSPTLTGNILTRNLCSAIAGTGSSPLLTRNTITQTQPGPGCAPQSTAPVVLRGGAPILRNNRIEHNDLTGSDPISAGIALLAAHATLEGNTLHHNTASNDAPSALSIEGDALLQQNLVYANTSRCGPAVSVSGNTVQLLNNTIADNLTDPTCPQSSLAAELSLPGPSQVLLANNILASSTSHPALTCAAPVNLHHNLLHNPSGPALANTCTISGDPILADPLFANPTQADYHLSPQSPALDAGSNSLAPIPAHDLDDAPRTRLGRIDLGAYEYASPRALAPSTTSLNATPNPAEAFQAITLIAQVTAANTTPTGSVTFSSNAQPLATIPLDPTGHATFTTTTLPADTPILAAAYAGSDTLAPSTSTLTQRIAPATTLLSFALTPSSADETQTVTLSASVVAPLSTQPPSGQVQFLTLNPSSVLATVPLDPQGHATTTLPSLPTGTWLIDAIYLGAPNFAPVVLPTSDALTLSIAARGYTLSSAASTVTIQSGHHAPVALTLSSLGTFAAGLTLTCANLPANASCTFSPASPSLTAGAKVPVTLTIDTDAIPGFLSLSRPTAGPTLALAFATLLGLRRRRRSGLLLGLLIGLTGCSSRYPAQVPSGNYPIQVVSQASGSSSTQTLQIALIVTN